MQVVAVVEVFRILRNIGNSNKQKAQHCSCFPLTYPTGFVWLSGLFVQNFRKGLNVYTVLTWLSSHV